MEVLQANVSWIVVMTSGILGNMISSSSTVEDHTCLQQGFCHMIFLCTLVLVTGEPRDSQKAH
jgi:uncharacterized membrane protein YqhA